MAEATTMIFFTTRATGGNWEEGGFVFFYSSWKMRLNLGFFYESCAGLILNGF